MASSADICIYGGAAGGGKTYALLLDPLRYKDVEGYSAVVFRRHDTQIHIDGGLLDESREIYGGVPGAVLHHTPRARWVFGGKGSVTFAHIDGDGDLLKWQGSQITAVCFDELTHFSERAFFYMLSRNRSTCRVRPYVRASCNPDADSWVAAFLSWWIDQETGYPIPVRSGKKRWMLRRAGQIFWADSRRELWERFKLVSVEERDEPKSVSFIASSVYDNKILLQSDPSYIANLKALPDIERERLLCGNWKIRPAAGQFFRRTQVGILRVLPADVVFWVRAWDLAATAEDGKGEPAYTAGVLMGRRKNGRYVVADVINRRLGAADVRRLVRQTAAADCAKFGRVRIRLPQDPGQAGKEQAQSYIRELAGYSVTTRPETGSKEARAEPVAAQWQGGNVDLLAGTWTEPYLSQLESFPQSRYKDMVDATSSAFSELSAASSFDITSLIT